jgi:hypothetical protein
MSARDSLLAEIARQPEPVVVEALHYIRYLARQREVELWDDVLRGREVEQEVMDLIDAP